MAFTYKPANYVVEVHIGMDVLAKDYGPEIGCAQRAVKRLQVAASPDMSVINDIRVWHAGKSINVFAE